MWHPCHPLVPIGASFLSDPVKIRCVNFMADTLKFWTVGSKSLFNCKKVQNYGRTYWCGPALRVCFANTHSLNSTYLVLRPRQVEYECALYSLPLWGKGRKSETKSCLFQRVPFFFLFLQKDDGINSILLTVLLALFADRTDWARCCCLQQPSCRITHLEPFPPASPLGVHPELVALVFLLNSSFLLLSPVHERTKGI